MSRPAAPRPKAKPARRAPAPPAGAPDRLRAQEQELKLRLRPQDVAALRARLDARARSRDEAVDTFYLDTPDCRLAAARAALRLRALGKGRRRRWVQTLKTDDSGAAFSLRGEWETAAPEGRLHPERLADSPLLRLLDGAGSDPTRRLQPVFRTRFVRSTWDLAIEGAQVEAVIDVGTIEAAGASEAILEAELELKAGSPAAVWRLALDLARGAGARADLCLLPYGDSKAARGYRLAAHAVPAPRRAGPLPGLRGDLPAADLARQLLAHEMAPLLANAAGVRADADPEYVHQARVCLRRIRACLEVLGVPLPPALERGLRIWSERFGAVRDWDVFCTQQLPRLLGALGGDDPAAWARIAASAGRRRAAAQLRLAGQLEAPAFAELALRLLQWSATSPAQAMPPRMARPVATVAAKELRKRLRRLARAGLALSHCTPQRQHRIRLQGKTVRYAIDALAPVLPPGWQATALRALARFQDAAGRAQDAIVVLAAIERLSRSVALRDAVGQWAAARRRKAITRAEKAAGRLSA